MTKEALYDAYWALREAGHGIVGAQVALADQYGIPMRYMTSISHPTSVDLTR